MAALLFHQQLSIHEKMPQTVPLSGLQPLAPSAQPPPQPIPGGFSPALNLDTGCQGLFFADSFDLSLLPSPPDCQVPVSPSEIEPGAFHSPPHLFQTSSILNFNLNPTNNHSTLNLNNNIYYLSEEDTYNLKATVRVKKEELSPAPPSLSSSLYSHEPCLDLEQLLDDFQQQQQQSPPSPVQPPIKNSIGSGTDHQLLRECLRDMSFQRRYNLEPVDMPFIKMEQENEEEIQPHPPSSVSSPPPASSLSQGVPSPPTPSGPSTSNLPACSEMELSRERIEPVLSLAIEQLRRDVHSTCSILNISPDPSQWSSDDVRAWLLWTLRQFDLDPVPMEYFSMDGTSLSSLTEEQFQQRAPQCGSTLYAQLEIWKAAWLQDEPPSISAASGATTSWDIKSTITSCSGSSGDASEDDDEEFSSDITMASPSPSLTASSSSISVGTSSSNISCPLTSGSTTTTTIIKTEQGESSNSSPMLPTRPTTSRPSSTSSTSSPSTGGSHIHLWQFLKELLSSPQIHGACIRWLDRDKGVFKIEDSVRVARLWGKRKNRPAMNYDKLSRSIRQYYKKGIMKKTERSQRLVYQFCHPYNL